MATRRVTDPISGDDLTAAVIRCRTYNHAWDEIPDDKDQPPPWGWRLVLRCTRCTTKRYDVIDDVGNLSTREYDYVDGYSVAMGAEKMTKPEYRQALYARLRQKRSRRKADAA